MDVLNIVADIHKLLPTPRPLVYRVPEYVSMREPHSTEFKTSKLLDL